MLVPVEPLASVYTVGLRVWLTPSRTYRFATYCAVPELVLTVTVPPVAAVGFLQYQISESMVFVFTPDWLKVHPPPDHVGELTPVLTVPLLSATVSTSSLFVAYDGTVTPLTVNELLTTVPEVEMTGPWIDMVGGEVAMPSVAVRASVGVVKVL